MDHASGIRPDGSQTTTSPVTSGSLVFRPGVASAGNAVATWAEVQKAIAATSGALTVLIDDTSAPAVVPASGTLVTDCKSAVTIAPYNAKLGTTTQLEVADTAQLLNLGALEGAIVLLCDSVTVPSLSFSYTTPHVFEMSFSSTLRLKAGALLAPIAVPTGGEFFLSSESAPTFDNSAAAEVPIVALTGTAQFIHFAYAGFNFGSAPVTGGAGSMWSVSHDATVSTPPVGAFTGTFNETRLSFAAQTQPSQGATTGRPANPAIGQSYFDTTLGSNTWWNGVTWIASVTGRNIFTAADVYLNALTGNDENDGLTPSTAWATHERFRAAVGVFGLLRPPGSGQRWMTVHYQGAMPADLLNLQATLDANVCLRFLGTELITVLHTGTITSAVNYTASNTLASITDTSVGSWTPYIDNRIAWTSGSANGCIAWLVRDLGSQACRISQPCILFDVVETGISFPEPMAPSTGTYAVQQLPSLAIGNFDIACTPNGNQIEPFINWIDLTLDAVSLVGAFPSPNTNPNCDFVTQGCVVTWQEPPVDMLFCGSYFPNGILIINSFTDFICCAVKGTFAYIYNAVGYVNYLLAEGCGLASIMGSVVQLGNYAYENAVSGYPNEYGDGLTTVSPSYPSGTITFIGQSYCCGSGGTGYGWRTSVGETAKIYYMIPTLTGADGDFIVGRNLTAGVATASAFINASKSYGTPDIDCTWANLATSSASGGFANPDDHTQSGAHVPLTNSHLILANP